MLNTPKGGKHMLSLGCVNSQEELLMGMISQECRVYNITLSPSHVSVLSVPLTTFLTTLIFFICIVRFSQEMPGVDSTVVWTPGPRMRG